MGIGRAADEQDMAALKQALLAGPRGRRLLLEYAVESERRLLGWHGGHPLGTAVFQAAYHLDPGAGTSSVLFGPGAVEMRRRAVSPEAVAALLDGVRLVPATPELLRTVFVVSVDAARYWQEPDGEDRLAGTAPVRGALQRVAAHLAASEHTHWWRAPLDPDDQWSTRWDATRYPAPLVSHASLREARAALIAEELHAVRSRPADPTANWTGAWWSRPIWEVPSSTRELAGAGPAGLWFVEDLSGWERATVVGLDAPAGARVFEVDGAGSWAQLCRSFPIEVTAQMRHDWYRATGRAGTWAIPDWAQVAERYDAVHLQAAAYLAAAGVPIPVADDTASLIAGWDPDQTYWFTSRVTYRDPPAVWFRSGTGAETLWTRRITTPAADALCDGLPRSYG